MSDPRSEAALLEARTRLLQTIEALVGQGPFARFEEALTHPSFANEFAVADNQRLEFLGDAVLGLCVAETLVRFHPDADEGTLTRMRAALVNGDALAEWARRVGLGASLAFGKGANLSSERQRTSVLADATEALVAAVYEERGLDGARALVADMIGESLAQSERLGARDPKSELQERVQAAGRPAPTYRIVETRGLSHDPVFVVEVVMEGVAVRGEGKSKRGAERAAAEAALADMK
ncbi:MAG: ribonuclease III [Polyangiaceae bacterium]|jgi:ribonuclease-3